MRAVASYRIPGANRERFASLEVSCLRRHTLVVLVQILHENAVTQNQGLDRGSVVEQDRLDIDLVEAVRWLRRGPPRIGPTLGRVAVAPAGDRNARQFPACKTDAVRDVRLDNPPADHCRAGCGRGPVGGRSPWTARRYGCISGSALRPGSGLRRRASQRFAEPGPSPASSRPCRHRRPAPSSRSPAPMGTPDRASPRRPCSALPPCPLVRLLPCPPPPGALRPYVVTRRCGTTEWHLTARDRET